MANIREQLVCHLWKITFMFSHVYHLSKITFMFCHVVWGQTGVSLLIRVCHLLKITFMFCHVLWGQMGVSLLIRVCHLSKITFMFCNVLWGQTGVSLLIRVCHLSKITFMFCHVLGGQTRGVTPHWGVSFVKNHICASHVNWHLCGFSSMCRQWHWWRAVTTLLGMTTYSNSCHHVDDMAPSVMKQLHRITKPYNLPTSQD